MKKFILTLWICLGSFSLGYSQSSDEKIADAMNNSDWFALDSLYQTEPRDSIVQMFLFLHLRNYSTLSQKILILAIYSIRL